MLPVRMLSILILLFSLCDADSICTTEFKMDPPEIIAEYGGSPVIVNCTTTLDEHDGMYWTVGNEIFQLEDEELFISHSVPVSDWNVTAECKMKLNESYECSKDLKVILFKNPEVVHSVQLVNVMGEETQYRLQCDIINVAPVQFLSVSWYKNNENIRTMSFNDTTKTPVNESLILRVDISREENVAQFRCEAELDFGPHGPKLPAISQTHSISAHYAPELKTNSTADIYQLRGTNIALSCEAEGNPPPVYNWICDGENMLENTNSLNITRVNRNKTCTCTATNYLGNITKTIHLHVEPRGCPLTLTPSETVVKFGDPVSVSCSTSARYVEGMGWEAPAGHTRFESLTAATWMIEKFQDWASKPSCNITLNDDFQCSVSPVITVYKAPEMVSVTELDNTQTARGTAYKNYPHTQHKLQCDIINVAPVQYLTVSWYKSNERIHTQIFNDTTTKTPVNESSILKINISREENVAEFRCEAKLDFGPHGPKLYVNSQTHRVSAHYAPEINTSCTVDISPLEGTNITLSCEAEGNPPPVYIWTCDGENMLENTNSLNITRVNRNKTCTCTATNYLGNITKTIHLHVEPRGCPLTLAPSEIVVRFGDPVSINCSTSATDVVRMDWVAPAGHTRFESLTAATWMIEKFQDWASKPSCNITLNDDFQCSVSPVITVCKAPEMVSVTELDNAQTARGTAYKNYPHTQHKLQCDIINVAPVQYLTVSWYKSNERIHTQIFNDTTTKTPVNESSILKINISREENVAEFRCEAGLDFGPHGPKLYVSSQTHRVSAHYAPEKNTKNSTQDIFLLEGTNITLSCEAVGNPPPVYNWTCDGKNMLENTNSLNITRVKHNATCTCTATNYLGNITHTINVHVKKRGCPLTLTPSETVVTFGDPVSINCSTSATDVEGMGWEAPFGGTGFERPPVVTWRVEKLEEWTPSPSCYVTLVDGSQCTVSPVITVYRPHGPKFPAISQTNNVSAHYAPELILESSTEDIFPHGGTDITLSCEVEGNPPPVYNWICDGENMLENTNSLNITRVNRNKTCTCTATNYLGNISKTINVHVTPRGCPLTLAPSEMVVRFEDPVSIKCSTSATDVAEMAWMTPAGDKEFKPGSDVTWMVKNLKWWTPSPFCSITLNDDFRCSVSPVIIVYKTPETVSISELNHGLMLKHKEDKKHNMTQYKLQCDIINVAPVQYLTITWYKNNKIIKTQSFNDTTKTPVNESSILRVDISREENVVVFRCEARLDFGPHGPKLPAISQTRRVSAHYAPEVNTKDSTHDYLLEGSNITLSCEAEGNPPSVYNWTCDGENMLENTNNLNITRVNRTKTCTCTAANYLGSVTKTIHVHVEPTGKTNKITFTVIWALPFIVAIIIFIFIAFYCRKQWKKHGHYSFVSDKDIPLNITQSNGSN
ncbi:hemicentin-1-like isoform X3 [Oreochromis aureus]|uniref:hemicentin-1-like isoform X3 n=1 Tax=Oreochromis aureus TaxID=47969 RepID=UPI0019537FFE|nr:hemicentin-1-like isoform X3 [Oreochromis aureus]